MRSLRISALLLITMAGSALSPVALQAQESSGVTVVVQTYDRATQASITDVCYVVVDASNEGCDENGDGSITFEGVPVGPYTVQQTQGSPGYVPVGEFPISLNPHEAEQFFPVYMNSAEGVTVDAVDIAIASVDSATGEQLSGACYILHGGSIEGCDENGDGLVDFEDVPVGSYYLEQTRSPNGRDFALPRWNGVLEDGTITVEHGAPPQGGETLYDAEDIALVTRNPESGELLTGACYIIENASNEGCDENGDGQVDFEDVAVGVYTVTQTVSPDGFEPIRDFQIDIAGDEPAESFIVAQRAFQFDATHRNVSIVLYHPDTRERISGSSACVVIEGVSAEGCDNNGDGQIDLLDIPLGEHTVEVTAMPDGYTTLFGVYTVTVASDHPYSIVKGFVTFTRE